MKTLLLGRWADENRRKEFLAKERRGEIELKRVHHHARIKRNPIHALAIAAGKLRGKNAAQFALGHPFEFISIDELGGWRDAARRLANQLLRLDHRGRGKSRPGSS